MVKNYQQNTNNMNIKTFLVLNANIRKIIWIKFEIYSKKTKKKNKIFTIVALPWRYYNKNWASFIFFYNPARRPEETMTRDNKINCAIFNSQQLLTIFFLNHTYERLVCLSTQVQSSHWTFNQLRLPSV